MGMPGSSAPFSFLYLEMMVPTENRHLFTSSRYSDGLGNIEHFKILYRDS